MLGVASGGAGFHPKLRRRSRGHAIVAEFDERLLTRPDDSPSTRRGFYW